MPIFLYKCFYHSISVCALQSVWMEVAKARFVNCYLPQKWVSLTGTVSSHYGHSIFTWRCIYLRHVLLLLWRSQYTTNNAAKRWKTKKNTILLLYQFERCNNDTSVECLSLSRSYERAEANLIKTKLNHRYST